MIDFSKAKAPERKAHFAGKKASELTAEDKKWLLGGIDTAREPNIVATQLAANGVTDDRSREDVFAGKI